MSFTLKRSLICLSLLLLAAASASALVQQRADSPLADKQFMAPEMEIVGNVTRLIDLPQEWRTSSLLDLQRLGVGAQQGLLDTRGARWGTLYPVIPLIPGDGVGNRLTWDGFGERPGDDQAIADFAWERVRGYMSERAESLRIDVDELEIRSGSFNDGAMVQFAGTRVFQGIPVRTAAFTAVLSHGNLALMGTHAWGDIDVNLTPGVSADDAIVALAQFIAPLNIDSLRSDASLAIVPVAVSAPDFAIGSGYDHRLAWVINADVDGAFGKWEALVDAHNGRMLSFQDLHHYGSDRNVNGGHYPITYDGIGPEGTMQNSFPMPFADITVGGPFTDAGGNFSGVGNATTTLSGRYVRINDNCPGSFSESSTGDIDLGGNDGDVDCDTPTSGDNTASARSGFYEVNRMAELARGQLPTNTWLQNQLTANMNINNVCNAFWNGVTINFYREGGGCGNTGQIGSIFDHEWGHGMDDNDVQGGVISTPNGGGEGIADLYASMRLDTSCVGRGFFLGGGLCGGYGDPCTPASGCTGVRDIDWANRTSGVPHDLTWVQTCGCCTSTHCRGAVYSETLWDLFKRDLPSFYGMDNNTAGEVVERVMYIGGGILNGWYSAGGTPHANCGATFGYNQILLADDDNGSLADGTPHMAAIASAFARHEIDCSPANGGPMVQDSGCSPIPTSQPAVMAVAGDTTATLSWAPVTNAASYNIYRTDGVFACDFGKTLAGSTSGTTFIDEGLKNDHPYSYVVIPMGAGGPTCFGPASECDTIGDVTIFADGFESGDTSSWGNTVP